MREIIFDTETTGLETLADRIIEIGAVELENRFPTGRTFHAFINPGDRQVHPEALKVHGITDEFLKDKPSFAEVVEDWVAFVGDGKLIAHNASFDVGFFNAEFDRLGLPSINPEIVIDSLSLARRRHPMGPNSLDALCRRYGIDNSHRTKHGALLDSELLAEVYIELVGGKQAALGFDQPSSSKDDGSSDALSTGIRLRQRENPLPSRISDEERAAHLAMVRDLGEAALWLKSQD